MLMAVVAMLASCSKDLTSDVNVGVNGGESVEGIEGGVVLVASVEDMSRVTVEGDNVAKTSQFNWEVGDELTVVYDGKSYQYVTTKAGRTTEFLPKDEANVFYPTDLSKPVAVFYNVKSVDAAAMTAVYDVVAEQTEGELTNKMPLYFYSSNVVVEGNKLVAVMNPLASVVELELTAAKDWNVDAVSLSSSELVDTYAVASGVTIDAATGAVSLDNAKVGQSVKVNLGAMVNLATARKVQAVVMGLTRTVTTTETVTGADGVPTEVTTTTLYAPLYHAKAVLKLYKNGAENARRTIWGAYNPSKVAVDEHKHIYQVVKDVLKDKVAAGISTVEQFVAFANSVNQSAERYPAGAEFSNEDGVVVLNDNITLTAQNWIAIGSGESAISQFVGIFDGNGKTINGLKMNFNADEHNTLLGAATQANAGLFGVLTNGGVIKNLTVEGQINVVAYAEDGTNVGGIVAQVNGGTVSGCTSKVNITVGATATANVNVGGVIGAVSGSESEPVTIEKCNSAGAVTVNDENNKVVQPRVGGVVGYISSGIVAIDSSNNSGAVTVVGGTGAQCYVGGIVGRTNAGGIENGVTLKDCENSGVVDLTATKAGWSYAGGISSTTYGGGSSNVYCIVVDGCVNKGRVSVTNGHASNAVTLRAGGILGTLNQHTKVYNCTHSGIVAMENTSVRYDYLGGIVGQLENTYGLIDSCTNEGTVCSMDKTLKEKDSSKGNIYTLVAGLVGNAGGVTPVVKNCVSKGYLLTSHDATNDWDTAKNNWTVGNNVSKIYQYRAAIFGNCAANQPVNNCQVGGYVGSVKGGDGADRYEPAVLHKLNNTDTDTYYWYRWMHGYNKIPAYVDMSFVDVE